MAKKLLALLLSGCIALSMLCAVPAFAASPWDGSSKTEPSKKDGVYQISSAAELAWFAENVNTLCAADTGLVSENAVLTEDIDLGGKAWTPIGLVTYVTDAYAGTFDGQYHTVSNLKIDASAAYYGFFGTVNTGTVKNLKVEGSVNSSNVTGGIIGRLQTGTVESCSFAGSVTTTGKTTKGYVGGIIGMINAKDAVISGCCNTADISGTYAGGILGFNKNKAEISNCYNTGTITGPTRSGGIAGQQSSGTISNCYNIGNSTNAIAGFSNATYTRCYYLNDETATQGGTATGQEKITTAGALLTALNTGGSTAFTADTQNKNGGYPLLSWQADSAPASNPVSTVTISGNAVTGETLTAQALGENGESATNPIYQWSVSADGESFTDIEGATAATYSIADTADMAGKYLKATALGDEESSAFAVTSAIVKSEALITKEDTERVDSALEALALTETVIKEEKTLSLPTAAEGCTIVWKSSNPEIISSNGEVTLPEKNIVKVVLTAEITSGEITKSKEFELSVWANEVDAKAYLDEALESIKWSFSSLHPEFGKDTNEIVKFRKLLEDKGFDGITVTIDSTSDEALISPTGRITYPAAPAGTFADGKQVQVTFTLSVGEENVTYPETERALLVEWDKSDIQASLEASVNAAVTENAIKGENESLNEVSGDLRLPAYLDGDKLSFAWIHWTSTDTEHLEISNENRQSGADSLYNPYVGKVYQDSEAHSVTLTAEAVNPSTGITVTREFTLEITAMDEAALNQSLDKMRRVLSYYTVEKLKRFSDKATLDAAAVTDDIQLVIPKEVLSAEEREESEYGKYWDYWNYKFSVTSSDDNVIEINSFRGFVYRPLGEDSSADKAVTLTVTMQSKANPNLSVSKELTVTVKHLTRAEMNAALALMDKAKEQYATGLLGSNTDAYSIIDSLSPFKEIVWNSDKTGVEFNRSVKEVKGNGIAVDTLPGWEAQEDWRLFRSGNKALIANETLNLNETPTENTFVKINSVLTDELFGKYYSKFKDDESYNKEALEKFRQLYKQPVSAYVMVVGAESYNNAFASMNKEAKAAAYSSKLAAYKAETEKPITVTFSLLDADGKAIISKANESSFTAGATVFDVFKKQLEENHIPYVARGSYIASINGLAEFDYGENSGWMYSVGGVFVNSYMNAQELSGGENIVVMYVKDFTKANLPIEEKPEVKHTLTAPAATVKSKAKAKTVKVSITKTSGADDYQIRYRVAGKKNWKVVASTNGKTTYTLKKLKKNKAYEIQVRAVNTADADVQPSEWSASARAYINKVTALKLKGRKKAIKASWKKQSKADSYQLILARNKAMTKGKRTVTVKKGKAARLVKKLKKGKKYFVKVRAVRTVNGKKYYGEWSKVKSVKVK